MSKVKKIFLILFILSAIFSMGIADQNLLMEKEKNELLQLNNKILKEIKNKEEFHNKKILVKVRRSQKDGQLFYKIEDISSDADSQPLINCDKGEFIIEGSLKENENNNYWFDIEHVIPPDDKSSGLNINNNKE